MCVCFFFGMNRKKIFGEGALKIVLGGRAGEGFRSEYTPNCAHKAVGIFVVSFQYNTTPLNSNQLSFFQLKVEK